MRKTKFGIVFLCAAAFSSRLVGQIRPADTVQLARTCTLAPKPTEFPESFARRCAEDFIGRNGYTSSAPAADSTLWVSEGIEFASSWAGVLRGRQNSLQAHAATVFCNSVECGATFRSARDPTPCYERIVTMTRSFKGMRMQHQGVAPAPGTKEARRCSRSKPKDSSPGRLTSA